MPTEALNIFLVDDDQFSRQLMEFAVRAKGYAQVTAFADGQSCLNALTDEPDVIFLDQMMDDVAGTEVLKAIKRFNPDIYVVFVSGQQEIEVAVESLKFGAFDYITKDEKLTDRIDEVLDKIQRVRELLRGKQRTRWSRLMSFLSFA
jgi:DNA-binding NtrC family response regulator